MSQQKQSPNGNRKRLGILTIARCNLKKKAVRTSCLMGLVAVLSFTLFSGLILTTSLRGGLDSMRQRLGADFMVVPDGNQAKFEGALLRGEPGTFYFGKDTEKILSGIDGIVKTTPQFFITSLSTDCCSYQVQLIGYEPKTDFVIAPWISGQLQKDLEKGELVVGSKLDNKVGDTLKFFGCEYVVAGRLEETGMGFDTSVFMNFDTAQNVLDHAREKGINYRFNNGDSISAVMVKAEDGYDAPVINNTIVDRLREAGIKADVVASRTILTTAADHIKQFIVYVKVFSVMLWVLTAALLSVVFTFSVHERKKEIAVLRILGATKGKLMQLIFGEAALIGAGGSLIGLILAFLILFPFGNLISLKLNLPFVLPSPQWIALLSMLSFLLTGAAGPAASVFSAYRIVKNEIHATMREGE
ncbi:FtsX-like permease family protein [Anoxybacterium hadale]|uniref:FtsX-like permease family protein n=1 Tax=Anoxybacterium hadale TaxID=3408580 RepID=A0ACD1AA42_9FIRM|nr:FtsX-like permease family protein [Clostridiales bacterium]